MMPIVGFMKCFAHRQKLDLKVLRRSMCMSFFVKCPKQRPVQGRFTKVQMYGAIEDKGTLPFGFELRAERLCTILKRPITVNVSGITKKDIHMLFSTFSFLGGLMLSN
jgi:hypothetical protein